MNSYSLPALMISLLLSVVMAWGQNQNHLFIEGEIEGFDGSEIYLGHYFGGGTYIDDTAQVQDGVFSFERDSLLPGGMYLIALPPDYDYLELILDKDQDFTFVTQKGDLMRQMKISGSEENELFYKDLKFIGENRKTMEAMHTQLKSLEKGSEKEAALKQQIKEADKKIKLYRNDLIEKHKELFFTKVFQAVQDPQVPPTPEDENGVKDSLFPYRYYKQHYFDNLDFSDSRMLRTPVFQKKIDTYLDRLTMKYEADSVIKSIDIILEKAKADPDVFQYTLSSLYNKYAKLGGEIMGLDAVPIYLTLNYYCKGMAPWMETEKLEKWCQESEMKQQTVLNSPAPDFLVKTSKGAYQQLSELDSKWIVLYFWSYDCSHCKKATPVLAEAFKKYKLAEKGVTLFTLNINGEEQEWQDELESFGLVGEGIINAEDIQRRSGANRLYAINSTPKLFLINNDQRIVAKQILTPQLLKILSREEGFEVEPEDLATEEKD